MGWVKTKEELEAHYALRVREFNGAKMLGIMFLTDPEVVKATLPPPLSPVAQPAGLIFIAEYPETNLGPGYREAALFLRCQYAGEEGTYCLSMPIDSQELRLINGREIYGFPKKMANIELNRSEDRITGSVERMGIKFIEINAHMTGTLPQLPPTGPTFLFKAMPSADLTPGFDGPVFLVRQQTDVEMVSLEIGQAEVELRQSINDPWAEIPIESVLVAFFLESNNRMNPGKVIGEVNPMDYLPYSFKGVDFYTGG
jgi:acetoacetate decarboxylase